MKINISETVLLIVSILVSGGEGLIWLCVVSNKRLKMAKICQYCALSLPAGKLIIILYHSHIMKTQILNNALILGQNNMAANV